MSTKKSLTIGEIVTQDFRAAEIFKNAGIDFCCGGNVSLEQTCKDKRLDISDIQQQLHALETTSPDPNYNFKEWELGYLCDYIVNTHHKTVLKLLPQLMVYVKKIATVHGHNHPELADIARLFFKINEELLQHLKKEEDILFPAIKDVLKTNSSESKKIVVSEITRMKGEHEFAGGAMDEINQLSANYNVPVDGCNTYQVTYKLLEQFEDDLHIHVHLENNILYPNALNISM